MLTVDQIQNISFKKASIGGYRCDEVDNFIDDVTATVEELKKQNSEIISKSELLMKKVAEYRDEEDSIHQVLLKSQKDGDKIVKEAEEEAKKILDKGHTSCKKKDSTRWMQTCILDLSLTKETTDAEHRC